MHLQIRFLIGLSKPGDDLGFAARFPPVADARASSALAILATHYPALSAVRGTGYWKGESEPNLVVESIVDTESEYWVDCDAVGFAQSVAGEVARVVSPGGVISEPAQLRTYECDGLTGYRVVPALVVLPATTGVARPSIG